jgi:hypothetical protein
MAAKTSGDSTLGVSRIIFGSIQNSFTTRWLPIMPGSATQSQRRIIAKPDP